MTQTLTGRRKYRVFTRMFCPPLLVLQVEVRETGDRSGPMDPYTDPYTKTFWRDATPEDLINEEVETA